MTDIKYYKIKFRLASPLAIGSGENYHTDSDIILDSRGTPVIPATAFAGIIRHYLDIECNDESEIFGYINGTKSSQSRVKFYDASIMTESFVTVRDHVALENKVGIKGAKFDMEALEANSEFVTLFELHDYKGYDSKIREAIYALNSGILRIGSKTSRGYGQIKIIDIREREFTLPSDREKWINFEPYNYENNDEYGENIIQTIVEENHNFNDRFTTIHLELSQQGAVSIRSYTVKNPDDISSADYVQLSSNDNIPVIPGTSWAGAFRERFSEFARDEETVIELYGFVDANNKTQKKSKIYFSESRISGGISKIITRNSIDRFSAGTKDGALYTEKTYYNGKTSLNIIINNSVKDIRKDMKIISAVICDLDRGHLAVGGLTSVGRGIFSVDSIAVNGKDITEAMKALNISEMAGVIEND